MPLRRALAITWAETNAARVTTARKTIDLIRYVDRSHCVRDTDVKHFNLKRFVLSANLQTLEVTAYNRRTT